MLRWKLSLLGPFLILFFVLGFALSSPDPLEAQTTGTIDWVRIASQPRPNGEALSVVLNGRLYSFGGFAPCCTPTRKSYYYDPKEDVWVRIADLPKGLTHAGIATDGRDIFIAGGYVERPGGGQIFGTNEVWRYSPANNTYQAMTPMPAPNSTGQLAFVAGNLHYIGGTTSGSRANDLDTHWVLNPYSSGAQWSNANPLPIPRQHAAMVVFNQQLYYIGGQKGHDGKLVPQNAVHRYDPATNNWTQLASMPGVGRNHISFSTLVYNGKIIVFGGQTYNNNLVDDVTQYDPATNTWTEIGKMFAPRASAIAGVIDGTIYYATGSSAAAYKAFFAPQSPLKIENFNLIDTGEDYPIAVIRDGSTVDLAALPSGLSIGVVFSGWPVGSVVMGWNSNPRFRVENGAPFAYYDNSGTNYSSGPIPLGANTLTATPYSGANGTGTAGTPLTVHFNVIRSSGANRPPTVTNPGNQASPVMEAITPLQITASDPDGHTLTYSATNLPYGLSINANTGVISGTPNEQGISNVTVTVRDNGSPQLTATASFTWTIHSPDLAVTAITLVNPATDTKILNIINGESYAMYDLPAGLNVGVEIQGSPVGSVVFGFDGNARYKVENLAVYSLYDNSGSNYLPGNLTVGTHTVTVTPYRGTNGTGTAGTPLTVTFTMTNNHPPLVTNPGAKSSVINAPITPLQINASDADGHTLTYSATGLPTGLTINASTGSITGTPTTLGQYDVLVTVVDNGTPTAQDAVRFNWTITPPLAVTNIVLINATTDQPIMNITNGMTLNLATLPPELNIGVETAGTIGSIVYGYDGNARFRVETLPVYGLFDNSGNNYLPGNLTVGSHTLTATPYTAANGGGTAGGALTVNFTVTNSSSARMSTQTQNSVVAPANQPPTITAPANPTSTANTAITPLQITASDPEGGLLRYVAEGLPTGLVIDPASGLITGTPTQSGAFNITVSVLDAGALKAEASFVWAVAEPSVPPTQAALNQVPVLSGLGEITSTVGETIALTLVASDPEGQLITYSATGLPTGLMLDASTGAISGSTTSAGVYAVTIKATDAGTPPQSITLSSTWTVVAANQPPTITPISDQSTVEGTVVSLQVVASDAEGPVSYAATGLPPGLLIDPATGLIAGTTVAEDDVSSLSAVTVTVTDSGGLTATSTFTWSVTTVP